MKFKILLFFFLTTSLLSFAQDTRLLENTWYLHNLIIDGVNNIPPVNDEIPYVAANFSEPDLFSTGMCESGGGGQVLYNGTTEFTLLELIFLAGGCYENSPFNENFNNLYVYEYWFASDQNPYNYTIFESGNDRTLTIVNSNGDEAVYGNNLLSTQQLDIFSISIYPNPVNKILFIKNKNHTSISSIRIYDISGKIIISINQNNSEFLEINVNKLEKGIYILSIEDEKNRISTKRIIKL